MTAPSVSINNMRKGYGKRLSISIIPVDLLPGIPAAGEVINRSGKFDP